MISAWQIFLGCIVLLTMPALAADPANTPTIDELLLFFPTRYPDGDWAPTGLRFQDVTFAAEDGTRLHGWYCPADGARAVVLLLHGNAGNVATRVSWLRYLQTELRVSTFIFDYRGYGRSAGTPTVEGALMDARVARTKLAELAAIEANAIVLMGESLGGALAVQLAAESSPRALILQSTFASLKDVADVHYPRLSWLVPPGKLNSAAVIADYHGPLLQSHGTADKVIPLASAERLHAAAHRPKAFLKLQGAGHNNWQTDHYRQRLDEFITWLDKNRAP